MWAKHLSFSRSFSRSLSLFVPSSLPPSLPPSVPLFLANRRIYKTLPPFLLTASRCALYQFYLQLAQRSKVVRGWKSTRNGVSQPATNERVLASSFGVGSARELDRDILPIFEQILK